MMTIASKDLKAADDIDAHVGSRVRLRRMTLNISQEQLGESLGLTFQQVQKYEKGQNRIGAGRLYKIAQILSVPVEFFYEGLPVAGSLNPEDSASVRSAEIQRFLASPDGHALSRAFLKIPDSATRRRIVDLVNTIAQEG
ncbi:MAG: helix-turn-helix transcriptional regulator [Pseudomonadota bacterium]